MFQEDTTLLNHKLILLIRSSQLNVISLKYSDNVHHVPLEDVLKWQIYVLQRSSSSENYKFHSATTTTTQCSFHWGTDEGYKLYTRREAMGFQKTNILNHRSVPLAKLPPKEEACRELDAQLYIWNCRNSVSVRPFHCKALTGLLIDNNQQKILVWWDSWLTSNNW